MKKIVLSILLCSFFVPMVAQVERHHTGGHGTVVVEEKEEPKKREMTSEWYNIVSINLGVAKYEPFSYGELYLISLGYKRLKRNGMFLWGPGIHINTDFDEDLGIDLILHGRIDFNGNKQLLGFKKTSPFLGISIGGQYLLNPHQGLLKLYLDASIGININKENNTAFGFAFFAKLWDGNWGKNDHLDEIWIINGIELSYSF